MNEAARLTELAKTVPGRVLAAEPAVAGAGDEALRRRQVGAEALRGRSAPTVLFVPD